MLVASANAKTMKEKHFFIFKMDFFIVRIILITKDKEKNYPQK